MEGYSVGIRLGVVGSVFQDLTKLQGNLGSINRAAEKLRGNLVLGFAKLGIGMGGLEAIRKMSGAGAEYLHILNMATVSGMKHAQVVNMVGDAWKEVGKNQFMSVNQNMRAMIDARKILGSTSAAFSVLPDIANLQTAIAGSADKRLSGRAEDISFGALKALDMLGKTLNPAMFRQNLSMMSQAIIWGQGRILPQDFQQAFKYERQSSLGLSSFFQYRILPSLMLEMKGGGGGGSSGGPGAMLAAFSRMAVQGIMSKSTAMNLMNLGLTTGMLSTTTTGTIMGHVKGSKLASLDPFKWVQEILIPAIHKRYGNLSNSDLMRKIMEIFRGNQLGTQLITWFANPDKASNIMRDAFQIGKAMGYGPASAQSLQNDPLVAWKSMKSQWTNISVAMTNEILKDLLPALRSFTSGLNQLALGMIKYPGLTKLLVGGFAALSAAMAISGTLRILTVGFTLLQGVALGISLTPVGRILAVVATLIAFLSSLYGIQNSKKGAGGLDNATIANNMGLLQMANGGHPFFNANDFLKKHPERDSRVHIVIHDQTEGGIHAQMHRRQIHETSSPMTHSGPIPATVGGSH